MGFDSQRCPAGFFISSRQPRAEAAKGRSGWLRYVCRKVDWSVLRAERDVAFAFGVTLIIDFVIWLSKTQG